MKILHIIFSFNVGGTETMLVDILNRQVVRHKVALCIVNNQYSEELLELLDERIKIIKLNRIEGGKNIFDLVRLNLRILRFKPRIIHSHNSNVILYLPVSLFIKTVCMVHANKLPCKGLHLYKKVYAISQSVFKELKDRGFTNLSIIYNGIDLDSIALSQMNSPKSETFRLVQVSRLEHEKKGQHLLLAALSLLEKKYRCTNVTLDFIGQGSSMDYLSGLVHKYELESRVSFLGIKPRSYIYSHLKDYDLLVQPSIYEGFGLTVAEAMAAAIPVLVSDSGGPLEIVNDGNVGYTFRSTDVDSLAEKLYWIINNPDKTKEMAIKGRQYVIDNFSINNTVINYEESYKRLLLH